MNEIGTVERAFQLAKSGEFLSIANIRQQLRFEQRSDVDAHLAGSSIRKQLMGAIALFQRGSDPSGA